MIRDWGLGIWIGNLDGGLGLGLGIGDCCEDWYWGLGLRLGIGDRDRDWGLVIGIGYWDW